ncbi:MAG: zinc-ribbon domain-containing protein [Oscillospiraceae bacterium]|jgi:hypothetical protein|nr:zinc-ribbon domain-containing protein [Oscillospiraceae bacterium]
MGVVPIVLTIIGLLAGIIGFFAFLSKSNEGAFHGFLGWLYGFLNFKSLLAETILRFVYVALAGAVTLGAVGMLFTGASFGTAILAFLAVLIVGNLVLRLIFEFSLITLLICKNTSEINAKLGRGGVEPAPVAPVESAPVAPAEPAPAPVPVAPVAPAPVPVAPTPAPRVCVACGAPLRDDALFCPECGARQ